MRTLDNRILIRGLIRPAMVMGVTLDYFVINGMVSLLLFIAFNSLSVLLLFIPLHLIASGLCKIDPYISTLILKRCLCLPGKNHRVWECQSYAP